MMDTGNSRPNLARELALLLLLATLWGASYTFIKVPLRCGPPSGQQLCLR